MKHFRLVEKVDTSVFLSELERTIGSGYISSDFGLSNYKKWQEETNYKSNHPHSGWVYLVSAFPVGEEYREKCNDNSPLLYRTPLCKHFPKTFAYLEHIAEKERGTLQRVCIVLLPPGKDVLPHPDTGTYYKHRNRYHLVLQGNKGSEFTAADEKQIFKEGEVWWFANKEVHSVKNLSTNARIHVIFDILPNEYYSLRDKITNSLFQWILGQLRRTLGKEGFARYLDTHHFLRNSIIYRK